MKLYYSPTSPYVRKVVILIHELGLQDQVAIQRVSIIGPVPGGGPDTPLVRSSNPLSKVPVLLLPDSTALFDSRVICEYLNSVANGGFFPPNGPKRWSALTLQALADGIMDASVLVAIENRTTIRPAEKFHQPWVDTQKGKIIVALDSLESSVAKLGSADGELTIGEVAVLCALEYLDLRVPDVEWRKGREGLAAWAEAVGKRPAMVLSRPPSE
ncbi:glutathione S-transferase domain-containing protein [Fimicolochytrium jonesii]|uniref:glutathione S-transferase domain-containing protein n=1 Tax=Fimicolochytrium jonesii TaxID=1396493 RepID=UPI0022FF15E5|nr:glutathione S-transferase domain-containing protein [Fimicolochytrium jonesii]KAI8822087.1 glutathione S-transferase domain-containing protein [Fimicolochytrium jonesii]